MEITSKDNAKEIYNSGYGYDHMYHKEYTSKGTANTALGFGIAGTAIGLASMFKNGGFNLFGNSTPENININTISGGSLGAPTAFQVYSKECDDAVALTAAIYQGQISGLREMQGAREIDVNEKFQIWKSQVDGDFGLYKSTRDGFDALVAKQNADAFGLYKNQRDNFDVLSKRISDLETKQAVADAIEPWRAKVLDMRIDSVAYAAKSGIDLEAERRCCADNKIVNYMNRTFYPVSVADVTTGTTVTPRTTYNPLCGCCDDRCGK